MGSLQTELDNLLENIRKTDDYMGDLADEFWANGGICCPNCGCPEYRELSRKQDNRYQRVKQLRNSLERSRRQNTKPATEDSVEESVQSLPQQPE